MRCNEVEGLLLRYVERDCSEEERVEIERHIGSCPACSASLEAFEELERSLIGLRDTIPAWKRAQAEFARRTGMGHRRHVPGVLWNPTTICGLATAALGVVLGVRGGLTIAAMQTVDSRVRIFIDSMSGVFSRGITGIGNVDLAAPLALYLLLIALPLLAFRAAYVRAGGR